MDASSPIVATAAPSAPAAALPPAAPAVALAPPPADSAKPAAPAQYNITVDVAVPLGASVEYRRFPLRCKLNGVVIASVHPNGQLARAIHAVGRSKVCCEGDRIVKVGDVNVSRKMETSELASLISELSSRARARGLSACFVQLTCLGTSGLPSKAGVAAPSKKYRKRKTNKDANKYKRVETA